MSILSVSTVSFQHSEVESPTRNDPTPVISPEAPIELDVLNSPTIASEFEEGAATISTPPEQQLPDLPPVDKGRSAWIFVAAGFILEFLFWGPQSAFGVFQAYYTSHPPFDKSSSTSIASIGTTALALEYGAGIILMRVFARYPGQLTNMMYCGVLLWTMGMLAASFCAKTWQLILFQGVIPGISAAIITFPTYIWVTEWFSLRRGFATGVIVTGNSLGGVCLPPITTALLGRVGVPWTLRIQALWTLVLGITSVFFLRPRLPVARGRKGKKFAVGFLGKLSFAGVALATFLQSVGYFPVGVFLPTQATVLGISKPSLMLSSFNAACIPGRMLWGFASDYLHYTVLMTVSSFLSSLTAYLLYGYSSSLGSLLTFTLLFGIIAGGYSSMWSQAARAIADSDPDQVPVLFAALYVSRGLGSVLGPVLASLLYKVNPDTVTPSGSGGGWGSHQSGALVVFVGTALLASAIAGWGLGVQDLKFRHTPGRA